MCSFNRVILKGLTLQKICVWCLCMYVLCLQSDWFCRLIWQRVDICEKSLEMCTCLCPEFDCHEVTLCGWHDIKIQLLLCVCVCMCQIEMENSVFFQPEHPHPTPAVCSVCVFACHCAVENFSPAKAVKTPSLLTYCTLVFTCLEVFWISMSKKSMVQAYWEWFWAQYSV